jgi:NADH-ubiquinone oxidoreductase chain 4L
LFVFGIGVAGMSITRKNLIIVLIMLELLLLAVSFLFAVSGVYLDDIIGPILSLYIISLAGAEAAVGLAILIVFYRLRGILALSFMNSLKG